MNCPNCNIEMIYGKTLNTDNKGFFRYIAPVSLFLKADTLKIIDCLKCPKCGHSDDGLNDENI